MKIDIPYYIRQVLREQREVCLPGLGTLKIKQSASKISSDKKSIVPPFLSFEYSETEGDLNRLSTYLKDTGIYSEKQIEKNISAYRSSALEALVDKQKFTLEGIGRLTRNEADGKISFIEDLSLFTDEFKDFPSLAIHPIEKIKAAQSVDHEVDMSSVSPKAAQNTPWWYTVLAGILLGLAQGMWAQVLGRVCGCGSNKYIFG